MTRSRILFVTVYDPAREDLGGASWVDRALIGALSEHADVECVVVCEPGGVPLEIRDSRRLLGRVLARMLCRGEPYQASKFRFSRHWREQVAHLRRAAAGRDAVVTSQTPAMLLAADARIRPAVHIGHNVDAVVADEYDPWPLRAMRNPRRTARLEHSLLAQAGAVYMLSRTDTERVRGEGIAARHLRLPAGETRSARVAAERGAIGLIGKAGWPPNDRAVDSLVGAVMPLVRRRLGDRSPAVVLAGRGTDARDHGAGVHALGAVADVRDFYERVDLVALPRFGSASGISVKLLEAHAHGVPVIAPERVARDAGLDSALVADDVEECVEAICRYYSGPAAAGPGSRGPDGSASLPELVLALTDLTDVDRSRT